MPETPPKGLTCFWCAEHIGPGELSPHQGTYHSECFSRSVFGSLAHQLRRCSCYGGAGEDDPTLTRRQNSTAAYALWKLLHPQ